MRRLSTFVWVLVLQLGDRDSHTKPSGKKKQRCGMFLEETHKTLCPPLPLENGSWRREKKNQIVLFSPSFIGDN